MSMDDAIIARFGAVLHLAIELENDEGSIEERYVKLWDFAHAVIESFGMESEEPGDMDALRESVG